MQMDRRTYNKIRLLWLTEHLPLRAIARKLLISRNTVKKWAKTDCYPIPKKIITQVKEKIIDTNVNVQDAFFDNSSDTWVLMILFGQVDVTYLISSLVQDITYDDAAVLLDSIVKGNFRDRTRSLVVIAFLRGISNHKSEALLNVSRNTIKGYIKIYIEHGVNGLYKYYPIKLKKHEQDEYKDLVFTILHSPPSDYGYNRTSWRLADLHEAMMVSGHHICASSLHLIIRNAGYRYKKARKVLTSTDPNYASKIKHITNILSNLKPSESFFSIDEFGPLSIKTIGGRTLTAPGEQKIVQQFQRSRGKLLLTGALELTTNQFTYFYSERKNTSEMIKLLHVLIEEYNHQERIYFSWDAASWHGSKQFNQEVRQVNSDASAKVLSL